MNAEKKLKLLLALLVLIVMILIAYVIKLFAPAIFEDEESYVLPKLSEVTCENLEHHYEKCENYGLVWNVSSCRERYTPKLMQCFGDKCMNER